MKHLKEHGGIYGLSVASDYEVMFPSGIEVEPKTVATGTESLEFLTYVSAQLLWYITGHTWDVCNYIHTLFEMDDAAIADRKESIVESFKMELFTASTALGISSLFSEETQGYTPLTPDHIIHGFGKLSNAMDAFQGEPGPNHEHLLVRQGQRPLWLQAVASPNLGGFWEQMPVAARAATLEGIISLVGDGHQPWLLNKLRSVVGAGLPNGRALYQDTTKYRAEALRVCPSSNSNLACRVRKAYYMVLVLSSQLLAINSCLDLLVEELGENDIMGPEFFAIPETLEGQPTYQDQAFEMVAEMLRRVTHPIYGEWVFDVPLDDTSVTASGSREASGGERWLTGAIRAPNSQYKMPRHKDPQADWQAWFTRISSVGKRYPSLEASTIIASLTVTIADTDPRILGWADIVNSLPVNTQPKLEDFVAHLKHRVLSVSTTKADAWTELSSLQKNFATVPDSLTLSTTVTRLFAQLFPTDEVGTAEPNPVTRLQAMLAVYRIAENIRSSGSNSPIVKMWKSYQGYVNAEIFDTYLKSSLHQSAHNTLQLCHAFLEIMDQHWCRAHCMAVETGLGTTDVPVDAGPKPKPVTPTTSHANTVAAAKLLGIDPNLLKSKMGNKSNTVAAGKRGREQQPWTPYQGPGAKGPKTNPGSAAKTLPVKAVEQLARDHPNLAPGKIWAKANPSSTPYTAEEISRRVSGKHCFMCLDPAHGKDGRCPLRDNPQTAEMCTHFIKNWHIDR